MQLNRASPRFSPDLFAWVSADATLTTLGGLSWGDPEFLRISVSEILPFFRQEFSGSPIISECELVAALVDILLWSRKGQRNILL